MTTERQKKAVKYCETILSIKFEGDINNFKMVSTFLCKHLERAKEKADEINHLTLEDIC